MAWKNVFGKKKSNQQAGVPPMEKLKETLDILDKRERVLTKKMEEEVLKAKEMLKKKNKNAALLAMKRKKGYEQQQMRIGNQKANIQAMLDSLEEATMNVEIFNAQRQGAAAVKKIYGDELSADKVEQVMDKVRDAMEDHQDITNAIAQPLGMDGLDDDELLAELDALETEELDKEMLGLDDDGLQAATVGKSPLPGAKVQAKKMTAEEEELAALESAMNS